jgi:outer membrane protein W
MTKRFISLAVVSLIAAAASAQTASVSAFATNPGYGSSSVSGGHYTGGWGLGAEYWFSPRVSAAVSVSEEHYYTVATTFSPADVPLTVYQRRNVHPIDGVARYRFEGNERWKPYVGVGFRVFRSTSYIYDFSGPLTAPTTRQAWNVDPEINGGVTFLLNRSLGIDVDAKRSLRNNGGEPVDEFRASVGLSWRF